MNYIKLLEKQTKDKNKRLIKYSVFLDGIVTHLNSNKFKGEENGERKDWIATGDILKMISEFKREMYLTEGN
jgi:hypothetical protein